MNEGYIHRECLPSNPQIHTPVAKYDVIMPTDLYLTTTSVVVPVLSWGSSDVLREDTNHLVSGTYQVNRYGRLETFRQTRLSDLTD